MKPTILGYENGYIVAGKFQSNCPFSGERIPVKVRVSVEGSRVVRDYKAPGDKIYKRLTEEA